MPAILEKTKTERNEARYRFAITTSAVIWLNSTHYPSYSFAVVVHLNPFPRPEQTLPDQGWERPVGLLLLLTARFYPGSFFPIFPPSTEGKQKKRKKIGVKVEEHFNL